MIVMIRAVLLAAMLLAGCAGGARPERAFPARAAPLRIVGYNDMDEMLGALARRFTQYHSGIAFDLILKSTRSGPPALFDGSADLTPMGAPLSGAEQAQVRARFGYDAVEIRIAHGALRPGTLSSPTGIFVHRDNPVRGISLADARAIFTASTHPVWGDLGLGGLWATRPIHRVGLGEQTAIGQFLLRGPLHAGHFATGYTGLPQSREAAAAVAADPLALGFANLNHARPEIRLLALRDDRGRWSRGIAHDIRGRRYPLDRHLLIYVRRDADGRIDPVAQAFLAFALSDEGQRIIATGTKAYLPLGAAERRTERKKITISVR